MEEVTVKMTPDERDYIIELLGRLTTEQLEPGEHLDVKALIETIQAE